jgi:hypothetical protein
MNGWLDGTERTLGRRMALGLALLVCWPALGWGAQLQLTSETLLRVFEREVPGSRSDELVVPGYEYLQVDAGSLGERGLSFHLYGWGRADQAGSDFFEKDTAGELLYGYLEYTREPGNLNLRLGRQTVFEGVANESLDGIRLSSDLGRWLALSLYGGQPVALDAKNGRDGDEIWGGRLSHHHGSRYDLGLSYQTIRNDDKITEERLGLDASLALTDGIGLYGASVRNLQTEGWAEHAYELRWDLAEFQLRPFYRQVQYDDFFNAGALSANPFRFLQSTGETLTSYGADGTWRPSQVWDLGLTAKTYEYDLAKGKPTYLAALLTWHGDHLTQVGGELGALEGDDETNNYLLSRIYAYLDQIALLGGGFVSGDLIYVSYDRPVDGTDYSLFASLGVGRSFLSQALDLALSADYSQDPTFDNDLRGMLVAKYRFAR